MANVLGMNPVGRTALENAQSFDSYMQQRQINQAKLAQENTMNDYYRQRGEYYPVEANAALERDKLEREKFDLTKQVTQNQLAMQEQKTDPMEQFNYWLNQYKNAKPGSPEQLYAKRIVAANLVGAPGSMAMGAAPSRGGRQTGQTVMGILSSDQTMSGLAGGSMQAELNPLTASSRSMKGAQMVVKNDDGTYTSYTSPTTQNESNLQLRQAGEAEVGQLWGAVQEGITPYIGSALNPEIQVASDIFAAKNGDKAAMDNLAKLAAAFMIAPETANTVSRMTTGTAPGIEASREMQNSQMLGLYPKKDKLLNLIPQEAKQRALREYLPRQQAALQAALEAAAQGYPVTVKGEPSFEKLSQPADTGFNIDAYLNDYSAGKDLSSYAMGQPPVTAQAQPSSARQDARPARPAIVGVSGRSYTPEQLAEAQRIAAGGR